MNGNRYLSPCAKGRPPAAIAEIREQETAMLATVKSGRRAGSAAATPSRTPVTPRVPIVAAPGDGIGPEITAVTVAAVEAVSNKYHLGITLDHDVTGLEGFKRHGCLAFAGFLV